MRKVDDDLNTAETKDGKKTLSNVGLKKGDRIELFSPNQSEGRKFLICHSIPNSWTYFLFY